MTVRMAHAALHGADFPRLAEALDPHAMRRHWQDRFDRRCPERSIRVHTVTVQRVLVTPAENVRITYLVCGEDDTGHGFEQWFHAEMTTVSSAPRTRRQEPEVSGNGPWKPFEIWNEMGMRVTAFPHDPKLPALEAIADPDRVSEEIENHRAALRLPAGWHPGAVRITKVKYRAGQHCVLRYEIPPDDPTAGAPLDLYCKTYGGVAGENLFMALREISAALAQSPGGFEVPRPIAYVRHANALWQETWPGVKLSVIDPNDRWARRLDLELLPRIATAMAAFHGLDRLGVMLAPGPTPDALVERSREKAAGIVRFLPRLAGTIERVSAAIDRTRFVSEEPLSLTLIHGTFTNARVLVDEDRLGLVGFDGVGWGDPHYDVAEFVASLLYLSASRGVPYGEVAPCADRFIDIYGRRVRWRCDRRRILWYVANLMLGKIHGSLETLEWSRAEDVEPAIAMLRTALTEIEAYTILWSTL